jgi:hypothetical protein
MIEEILKRKTGAILFTMVLMMVLVACRSKKDSAKSKEPIKHRTAGHLLRNYERNQFDFEWIGMKIDAESVTMGETQGFKATLRMRKDSAIWVSISPALGIEVFRILITPDSLSMISKIPDNKFYYQGGFEVLSAMLGTEIDFDMLQNLLVGNALGLDKDEGRFRSEVDESTHLLISKYKRKVRRVVGVDDRKLEDDTIVINPNDPRYQRTIRRLDENDEMIISRYWLEPEKYRLVKSIFNDLIAQRSLEVWYADFEPNNEQYYPALIRLKVVNPQITRELNLEITKLVSDRTFEFTFEIPEDFPKKDSL